MKSIKQTRPYLLPLSIIGLIIPISLLVDVQLRNTYEQMLLGFLIFFILYRYTFYIPKKERIQIWACVFIWTLLEIFLSLIWGLYTYRFENIPLYVPPGHGFVYLFALTAARTPFFLKHIQKINFIGLLAAIHLQQLPAAMHCANTLLFYCRESCLK